VTLVGRRSPERDPGLTKDILQRRDRIVVDLGLLILIRVVVNGDLEYRLVRTLRVSLPAQSSSKNEASSPRSDSPAAMNDATSRP
jgi:hypothetical protein